MTALAEGVIVAEREERDRRADAADRTIELERLDIFVLGRNEEDLDAGFTAQLSELRHELTTDVSPLVSDSPSPGPRRATRKL